MYKGRLLSNEWIFSESNKEAESYVPLYQLVQSTELVWNILSNGKILVGSLNDTFTSVIDDADMIKAVADASVSLPTSPEPDKIFNLNNSPAGIQEPTNSNPAGSGSPLLEDNAVIG